MKQVGGFEIPLYKHAVKVFVGLPDDDIIYKGDKDENI